MDTTNGQRIALYEPLYLTLGEMKNPQEVLKDFFSTFSLDDVRGILFGAFTSAMCQNDDYFDHDPEARANLLWSLLAFERVLEASYLVMEGVGSKKDKGK